MEGKFRLSIGGLLLCLFAAAPGLTQGRAAAGVRATVRAYLEQHNLDTAAANEIEFPAILERTSQGAFRVTRMSWDRSRQQVSWELHCVPERACVPFVAWVSLTHTDEIAQFTHASQKLQPVVVRAGSQAELVARRGTMLLRWRVICLSPGRAGDSIRARILGENRILRARVLSATQLEME